MVAVDVGEDEPAFARVVGMVGDVRMTSLAREPQWQMYYTYGQSPNTGLSLAVRTAGDPAGLTGAVREALRARDPDIPLGRIATMEEVFWDAVATPRILMAALSAFALVALFLSGLGLYSVLAFYVLRRVHEIGIRVAMGAYQVEASDPATFGGVSFGLLAVGLLACLIPAWRAVRVDPVRALQTE